MIIYPTRPGSQRLKKALVKQQKLSFSYSEVGAATAEEFPPGYDHDRNRCYLGEGPTVFAAARRLIQTYAHFPTNWAFVYSDQQPPTIDLVVATTFRQFGLWWLNGAKIVEVIDRDDFYGFSYGTLSSHVEIGEELFYTEMTADGKVYYGINAFSRPRFWGARLLKPYARSQQRKFVLESMARMQEATKNLNAYADQMA